MKVRELTTQFEQFAPQRLAMAGDPVGLQLGSLDAEVSKVLVTLDVRPEVVDEAIAVGADLIFAITRPCFDQLKTWIYQSHRMPCMPKLSKITSPFMPRIPT